MRSARMSAAALGAYAVLLLATATSTAAVTFSEEERAAIRQHAELPSPPADPSNAVADVAAAAQFGQRLFFDPRLSLSGDVACSRCHVPERSWTNGEASVDGGGVFPRNVPALWNTAQNRWFFWDGRADSAWAQALGPLENPTEHGGTRLQYVRLIGTDPALRREYESVFGAMPDVSDARRFPPAGRPIPTQPRHPHQVAWAAMAASDRVTANRIFANLGKAIAAYVRRLVSRDAPFDAFVRGLASGDAQDLAALSESAQRGLQIFVGRGQCRVCHTGPLFSDGEFHDVGLALGRDKRIDPGRWAATPIVIRDPFNALGPYSDDPGRGETAMVRYLERVRHGIGQFKTPSLRQVAETAPYMHDGRFATLAEVVEFYSTRAGAHPIGQRAETILQPLHLTARERADLVAFLESLTGRPLDVELTRPPGS